MSSKKWHMLITLTFYSCFRFFAFYEIEFKCLTLLSIRWRIQLCLTNTIAYSTNRTLKLTKSSCRQLLLKNQESRNKVSLIAFIVFAVAVLMPKDALSAPTSTIDVKDDMNLIHQVTNVSALFDLCNLTLYRIQINISTILF